MACLFVVVESIYGATFAHQVLDLTVLTIKKKEISFIQSLKRHLLDPIDILLYGIPAIIAIKNSEKHQRLGDMWAKIIVVIQKTLNNIFLFGFNQVPINPDVQECDATKASCLLLYLAHKTSHYPQQFSN